MKILWGLEPESQNSKPVNGMYKVLRQFSGNAKDVEVGYVVTENEMYLHTAFDVPPDQRFTTYPKRLIMRELKKAKVRISEQNVHVVNHPSYTNTKAADRFMDLGKSRKAKLLALFTKGKKGIERLVIGSFAETAVHRSYTDILLVGPKARAGKKIQRALYASDFGANTKKSLRRVFQYCKLLNARLTVFHSPHTIYKWAIDERDPEVLAYRKKVNKLAGEVSRMAEEAGVVCDVVVATDFRSPAEHALDLAKDVRADLLVVSAKIGRSAALMGGSVTRQVVRNGVYPVLVLK